jgi:hypothetical protein
LDAIDKDQTFTFHIQKLTSEELAKNNFAGETRREGNDIYMVYNGDRATLAHELKHGNQYLTGELSQGGFTTDMYDEMNALIRGFAYDEGYKEFGSFDNINYSSTRSLYGNTVSPVELNINTPSFVVMAFTKAPAINNHEMTKILESNFQTFHSAYLRAGIGAFESIVKAYDDIYKAPINEYLPKQ